MRQRVGLRHLNFTDSEARPIYAWRYGVVLDKHDAKG